MQVEDAFAGEWRGARTRRASASPDCDGDDEGSGNDDVGVTYGRSAWCGPLWDVWMELLCVLMVKIVVVGDGGVDAEWMREQKSGRRKKDIGAGATSQSLVQQRAFQHS